MVTFCATSIMRHFLLSLPAQLLIVSGAYLFCSPDSPAASSLVVVQRSCEIERAHRPSRTNWYRDGSAASNSSQLDRRVLPMTHAVL